MRRCLVVLLLLVPLFLTRSRAARAGSCEDECDPHYDKDGPSCESEDQRREEDEEEQRCIARCAR